jgi:hypothetical protein
MSTDDRSTTPTQNDDPVRPVPAARSVAIPGRIVLGLLVPVGAIATLYLWFIGWVNFTGCFISCGEPDRLAGAALLTGAAAVATGTLLAGWVAITGTLRWLREAALVCAGIVILLVLASLLVP